MRKIVILGGGISGLSLLWYLRKQYGKSASITLLEKTSRAGGWIRTLKKEGFLFERGPRSCRTSGNGKATLQLVEELGLQNQVIAADPSAHDRFLYLDKRLQKVPSSLLSLLFSPLTRKMIPQLMMEWKVPRGIVEDESIHAFFTRRLGVEATDTLLDPLSAGIYAGNIHHLSAKSCFPQLFQWERQYGSLMKGAFFSHFSKNDKPSSTFTKKMDNVSLFSFKDGMESLPQALGKHLEAHILTDHEVTGLRFHSSGIDLQLINGRTLEADQVYSTLPAHVLSPLIRPPQSTAADLLKSISAASVAVVSLGYKQKLLSQQGFGYLVPSKEKENILGMVWDSCVFPQQSLLAEETRLTVMMGGTRMFHFSQWNEFDFLSCALEAVSDHLQIQAEPDVVDVHIAHAAIPQYEVGHQQKKIALQAAIEELSPRLTVLGSSFDGVSVNDCIANAKQAISN